MNKLEEIEQEIKKLENKEYLTYDICSKLADLYICRKFMAGGGSSPMMPTSGPAMPSMVK